MKRRQKGICGLAAEAERRSEAPRTPLPQSFFDKLNISGAPDRRSVAVAQTAGTP